MFLMEYPEVKEANGDIESCYVKVKALGYEYVDSGRHARVFTKGDRVVKVGLVNADNYLNYVRMVGLRTHNPHLPFIFSVNLYDQHPDSPESAPYYVVEMEKLAEGRSKPSYWHERLGVGDPSQLNPYVINSVKPKTDAMKDDVRILKNLYTEFNAVCDIGGADPGDESCTANVMFRGTTAVFTDPVV